MLKLCLLSTVMTVTTTKLTRLYKLFVKASLGPVKLYKMWGTGHLALGQVLLALSWVGLFVLLCAQKR